MVKKMLILILTTFVIELMASNLSIAVLDFEPRGIPQDEAVLITDILRTELLKTGRITIIEREKINALLKERKLSDVGITESVELGKILGVDKIVFGRIGKLGSSYMVTIRMIDVSSGKVDFADQKKCEINPDAIEKIMKEFASVIEKYLPPMEGTIALRSGNTVFITLSSKEGIEEGAILDVYRIEQVKDEEGNVIFEDEQKIGKIKVLKVSNKGSKAEVIEESEKIRKGDVVRVVKNTENKVPSENNPKKSSESKNKKTYKELESYETILKEDFENIPIGTLPAGFKVLYSGSWCGVVKGEVPAASGKKVLKVRGASGCCCNLLYPFDIFNYKKIIATLKIYVPGSDINGWVNFVNPDIGWGWSICGIGVWGKDKARVVNTIIEAYNTNKWNDIKLVLYTNERCGEVYVNGALVYKVCVKSDGLHYKIYRNKEEIDFIYKDTHAIEHFEGINAFLFGDCLYNDVDIPTYFDDVVIIGYK